ncbi:MAG: aminopeptidase P family protein [Rhodothermales bacterium]|nr:aminopeptidase P family protein [Rhodothermales bacterium]MBO6781606.1 aminopeptidase P family protein [Rhodothermales bacterium]
MGTPGAERLDRIAEWAGGPALISHAPDIRWACGFTGSNALLLIHEDARHLITDGRYTTQAAREVHDAEVHIAEGSLFAYAARELLEPGRVVLQSEYVTLAQAGSLSEANDRLELDHRDGLVAAGRANKSLHEVEAIRAAQALTESVFLEVVPRIRAGMSEAELAAELVYAHLKRGASGMSFDPIVAAGPNSAMPHARPGTRALQVGEPVLIDMGCFLDGYASDMTRMVHLGPPGPRFLEIHTLVNEALEAALAAARAGMQASALDETARSIIRRAGFAEHFSHSLGHGVGLEIHEKPAVSHRSPATLPPNSVVTLEPGVYLPGAFGVRIEDIVVLRPDGCERLTTLHRDLTIV